MRFPRLSISLLALCAAVPAASADTLYGGSSTINLICGPTPTLSQCQDSGYTTLCTNWSSTCAQMNTDTFNQNVQSITTTRTALAPDNTFQAGSLVYTRYIPYDFIGSSSTFRGGTGGYWGAMMNHRAWVLNPTSNGTMRKLLTGFRYIDPEAMWQVDGTRVSSCEEYVYKRYRTASQFEDAIAGLADDWMGILRKALNTGFFRQEIDDETGAYIMNWGWPAHAKNIFFEINLDQLPLSTYPWDPTLRSLLAAHPERTPSPDPLTLLNQVSDQLSQWGEDKVELRYEDQKEFRKTLADRAGVWNDFQTFWHANQCDTAVYPMRVACDWEHLVAQGKLYNIDQDLQGQLWKGYLNGCLYSSGMDPCGMGPHQLVDEMMAAIDALREPDYKQCRRITNDNFSSSSVVGVASSSGLPGSPPIAAADYTATSAALKGLLGLVQQQFNNVQLPVDQVSHTYVLGSSTGDSSSFGSGYFGASYGYGAGWRIDFGTLGDVTSANVHVFGSMNAHGTVLDTAIPIVDFASNVDTGGGCVGNTPNTTVTVNSHFTVLGQNFFSPVSDTEPAQFNVSVGPQQESPNLWSPPPIIIPIGFVPVTITGGLSGGIGYSATLQGSLTRDCTVRNVAATIGGGFAPFAHLDAFAAAKIGIPSVLEAGIRGTVTLARVDVPFSANLSTTAVGPLVTLNGSSDIDPTLTTFGGRIVLFVDSLVYSAEMTLASWPGATFGLHVHLDFPGGLLLNAAAGMAGTTAS